LENPLSTSPQAAQLRQQQPKTPSPAELLLLGETLELLGRLNPFFRNEMTQFGRYCQRKTLRAMPEEARRVYAALANNHTVKRVSAATDLPIAQAREWLGELAVAGLALRVKLNRATVFDGEPLTASDFLFWLPSERAARVRRSSGEAPAKSKKAEQAEAS
jgi:hypothetical protein